MTDADIKDLRDRMWGECTLEEWTTIGLALFGTGEERETARRWCQERLIADGSHFRFDVCQRVVVFAVFGTDADDDMPGACDDCWVRADKRRKR